MRAKRMEVVMMVKLRLDLIDALLNRDLEWIERLAEEALRAEKFEDYYKAFAAICELVEGHQLIASFGNTIAILTRRPLKKPKKIKKAKADIEIELDIDALIRLGWAKLTELDAEAQAALESGDYKAYLETTKVMPAFMRTLAHLIATKQKLKGKEKAGKDLATLLAQIKRRIIGLIWRRRK